MMNQTVIVYASVHHGNTRKLAEAIAARLGVDLIDANAQQQADLSRYALIGFASGIDFGRFYGTVERFLEEHLPEGKKVFFLYTCAKTGGDFTKSVRTLALERDAVLMGEYGCRGYNTYGPLKLIGGMNKRHPTESEIEAAVSFYEEIARRAVETPRV